MMAGALRGLALLGALPPALGVHKGTPQNMATFVLPDGQVVLDGDTYATVVGSDGTEHAELEHRKHIGYTQRKKHQVGRKEDPPAPNATSGDPVPDPLAGNATFVNEANPGFASTEDAAPPTPEELRGCEDTEGWVNGFTGPSQDLFDFWLEAEAEIESAGHKGVMMWINGKGNTCTAYVFMGICVNMKWIDDTAEDYPCMMDSAMGGHVWNHPEENCCACGKAHVSRGGECSNETKIKILMHRKDMVDAVGEAFEGSLEEKREHDFNPEGSLGAAVSLLAAALL